MNSKPTVLVVGSTGMLGSKIISALLDKGATEVRAMVRPGSDSDEKNRQSAQAQTDALNRARDTAERDALDASEDGRAQRKP